MNLIETLVLVCILIGLVKVILAQLQNFVILYAAEVLES